MNRKSLLSLITVSAALTLLPLAALAAQPLPSPKVEVGQAKMHDIGAAKNLLKQRHAVQPHVIFQHDASLASCSAYVQLLNKANADFRSCTNPDNPPAGSPIAKFNAYTNMQLGQFCGNMTMQQCVDKVNVDQQQYCHQLVMPIRQQAEKAKKECSEARAECSQAKKKLTGLEQKMPGLDARKKQLEAELAKLNTEIQSTQQSINAARQEVQRECTGSKPMPGKPEIR